MCLWDFNVPGFPSQTLCGPFLAVSHQAMLGVFSVFFRSDLLRCFEVSQEGGSGHGISSIGPMCDVLYKVAPREGNAPHGEHRKASPNIWSAAGR